MEFGSFDYDGYLKHCHFHNFQTLDIITNVTHITNATPENALPEKTLKFWFQDVFPLMFDANQGIQNSAIEALEAVIPFLRYSSYQEHPDWPELQKHIINE